MDYEIVATLGPGSLTQAIWQSMLAAGVTAFRLNTSHLTLAQLEGWIDRINTFLSRLDSEATLVLDLQGSKWRLGALTPFVIQPGQRIELVHAETTEKPGVLPIPHADFFLAAPESSGEILLNDAKIVLRLEQVHPGELTAAVLRGGEVSARKGITYSDSEYRLESLNEKDRAIIESTQSLDFIR